MAHFTPSIYVICFLNYNAFVSHESFKRVYFLCREIIFKFTIVTEKFKTWHYNILSFGFKAILSLDVVDKSKVLLYNSSNSVTKLE